MGFSPKTTKIYIFVLFSILLILPFIVDLIYFNKLGFKFLLESSPFGFDYGRFFSYFFYDKSVFTSGNYTISALPFSFLFGSFYLLQKIFTPINSLFLFLIIAITLSYYFFVKLFGEIAEVVNCKKNDIFHYTVVCVLGLIFFTSLSNFIFLSSTIIFLLPTLVLIIQLFFIKRYVINDEKKWLVFFVILNGLALFNITIFLINIFFTNIFFYILFNIRYSLSINKDYFKKVLFINVLYVPYLILVFLQIVVGSMYIGPLSDVASSARENFYSLEATFLNTFTQTSYWGLFGGFNGSLYFDFSSFYKNSIVYIFSFVPYILIAFFIIKNAEKKYNNVLKKMIIYFLLLFLFVFQFMLGLNNQIYKFLYENITLFQIFRNISKFAPILLFLTILILFLLILENNVKTLSKKIVLMLIILSALIYNIPYWTYSLYFFENRSIADIPQSYRDVANFLNKQLTYNDSILLLPATYSLDNYYWNSKKIAVQGNIFDVFLDRGIKSYRLNQGFTGSTIFQKDSTKLFVNNDKNVRGLDIDYRLLTDFVKKYNLNYIVVTKDLVSEYQNTTALHNWLSSNNYQKINSFGNNDIYFNHDIFKPILSFGSDICFQRKNAKDYRIYIKDIKKNSHDSLVFFESFSKYWNLYLKPISEGHNCDNIKKYESTNNNGDVSMVAECQPGQKIIEKGELSYLWEKSVFDDTHQLVNQYDNSWTIDPEYIKQNFSKEYYKENPEGSIDIELTLYFKPQSYFYLGLIISGTTLLGGIIYLILASIILRNKGDIES